MKLKYTLVFTIISFFIATVGFAQTYSDQQIGLNVDKLTVALKKHGIKEENIEHEISRVREMNIEQYIQNLKKQEAQNAITLKTAKSNKIAVEMATPAELAQDRAGLIALYNSTNGANWTNTQQGQGAWPINDPNAVIITSWDPSTNRGWYGISIDARGRVVGINLDNNNLSGTLPSQISQLSALWSIQIKNNISLTGAIPTQIGQLHDLLGLDLTHNSLSGSIPAEIGQLSTLIKLDLSSNPFTGSLPITILNMSNLKELDLSYIPFGGNIPPEIGNLSSIETLVFFLNGFTGPIPVEINNLSKVEWINLGGNDLTGDLPMPQIGQLPSLKEYHLDYNHLTGTLPAELKNLTNLGQISVYDNEMTGSLPPELGQMKNVYALSLAKNNFTGTIPPEIGEMTRLYGFDVTENQLTGNIPETFQNLKNLQHIDIGDNNFSGKIPDLTVIPLKSFTFYRNAFRFVDFADEHAAYKSMVYQGNNSMWYVYCQQAFVDEEKTIVKNSGDSVTFTMYEDGRYTPNDTYQWYHFHGNTTLPIPGATSRTYTVENIKLKDSGDYYCISTNPYITDVMYWETNLYLTKNTIHLNVNVICEPLVGTVKTPAGTISANQDINISFETGATNLTYNWTLYDLDNITVLLNRTGSNINTYYELPGTYKINLVVTDENQCTTSFDKTITILPQNCSPLVGNIKTSTTNFYVNAYANFYFDSAESNLSYLWTVYDLNNNISDTFYWREMDKAFTAPGNYRINLVVTDGSRCKTSFDKFVTVTQGSPCTSSEIGTIDIGENDTTYANTNNEFHFNSDSPQYLYLKWTIYNPDNTVYSILKDDYYWSNLNFTTVGQYRITVELTDMSGCTATISKPFSVIQDCRKMANIYTADYSEIPLVLPNTEVAVSLYPSDFNLEGMQQDWEFTNPSGEIITTGSGNIFNITPTTIGNYKINVKVTDPATGCINNFSKILQSVDECTFTDKNRFAYISPNGEYAYSNMALSYNINDTVNFGLFRPWYNDTGKIFNLEWSLYNANSELVSTSNEIQFPITLTTPGFHKLVVNVIDPDTGCSTQLTRSISSTIQGSCTETNERSYHVQDLAINLVKRLIIRSVVGETDAQINANSVSDEFIALKRFITNSPKDKVYNFVTVRNEYGRIDNVTFSFSPDRTSDIHISIRDGLNLANTDLYYLEQRIEDFIIIDLSQYVSSDQYLGSCSLNYPSGKIQAKSIIEPDACYFSSEIKNINFCPPACTPLVGTIKTSTQEIFTNRIAKFSFESTETDLTYKWTFYDLDNNNIAVFTTNTVDRFYSSPGNYNVTLEVTDANGCFTNFEKTVIVTVNTNCTGIPGTIVTTTPDVYVGTNTNFSLETTATDLTYRWTFTQDSESTIFTTKTVDYTYIRPGTNNVTLEVTDSNGCKSTFQKLVSLKTGSTLCNDVTQFGRAFVQVGSDADLYKAATVSINQTTNVTFSSQNYGPGADFEYKWSLLNENNQLVDSGTNLNFPITPTRGGFYTLVLDLKENTTGCIHQFTRAIICTIPNSCAQTNPESTTVKGLVINLLKNLMSRAMMGESDAQINSSAVTAEFIALKPYITSGSKDKIYNFASTRNLSGEFTSVDFSFSPDRVSDIHVSVPHSVKYDQGMPLEYLQSSIIEPKLYIDLSQYTSANQYLVSCYTQQSTGKSLLKPNDCQYGSEIRFIDFCPNECDPLLGVVKVSTENPTLNTAINFSLETAATGLSYNWTFYNADNTVKGNQTSSIGSQTYTAPGNYKIVLVATNSNNCATTFTKNINISSCAAVSGTIKTVSPNIFAGTTANFFFDTTATNLTYQWTFYRNVNSSTVTSIASTTDMYYDTPGNYNVKLVVTDTNGCTSTFRTTAVVTVKPPCVNVAGDIKTVNPIIYTNETTIYSFDTTATNLTYNWTFHSLNNTPLGTATTSTASVVYPYTGNYVVTLVIVDQNNCVTTINKNVTVQAKHICTEIVGSIKTSTEKIKTNNNTIFSLQTTATNITYKWIFYNTNSVEIGTAATSTAEWVYTTPGDYLVALEITDQYACKTTLYKTVKVTEPVPCTTLDGEIKMDTETPFLYTNVTFTFDTTATDLTYTWNVKIPENGGYYNYPQGGNPFQLYLQYGEGEYTILLDVKDSNDCVTHFEKKITPIYDCSRNSVNGALINNAPNIYRTDFLINASNSFTFYPYGSWNLSDFQEVKWELLDMEGNLVTSTIGENFIFTPTSFTTYILNLTIKDREACPHIFSYDVPVVDSCVYSGETIDGFISFQSEDNTEILTTKINEAKMLLFNPTKEIDRNYTYKWQVYNSSEQLLSSGTENNHPLTLTNPGFYKVTLDLENEYGCIKKFSKTINCLIENSCTYENPKSEIVKKVFVNFVKNLIVRSLQGETDTQINSFGTRTGFTALKAYITSGIKNNIYNYSTSRDEKGKLTTIMFSFSPETEYDVKIYVKKGIWDYDQIADGTTNEFASKIESEIYLNLEQFISPGDYLVSCFNQKPQNSTVTKFVPEPNDCYLSSEIRHIDFCPAEACLPTIGVIKTGTSVTYPSQFDKSSKQTK